MAKLTTIEGIGPAIEQTFRDAGIRSVEKLLEHGASKQGRSELAKRTGLDEGKILRFVNHSDLMRIRGVGGEYSELLEAAGVDSVVELARRNPTNLHQAIVSINAEKKLVRQLAARAQVEDWIEQAKALPRGVYH